MYICLRRKVRQKIENEKKQRFEDICKNTRADTERMQCAREKKNNKRQETHDGKIRIYEIFIVECKLQNVQLLHI